ncbi:MAG: hypothetical protein JSS07_01035 [Proteobacteria bacterium]|nr:hypothetical protein [Pseudomonadota bacterium]
MRTLLENELCIVSGSENDSNGILQKFGQFYGLIHGGIIGAEISTHSLKLLAMVGYSFSGFPVLAIITSGTTLGAVAGTCIGAGIGYGLGAMTDAITGK